MADDSIVRVVISGSVDPSLAASAEAAKAAVADLGASTSVSARAMSDALKAAGGDLSKISPQMLGLAASTTEAAASAETLTAAVSGTAAAMTVETAATEANTVAHVSNRAAYEALVLVHEALSGRFSRMAGSSMILTQALAGQAATSSFLSAVMSPLGIATLAVAGAAIAATVATAQYEAGQRQLTAATIGLGAASGITLKQLQDLGETAAQESGQSTSAATASAEAFTAAGVQSGSAIERLSALVQTYAALTGEKAAEAQKELAEAMADPAKGADTLNAKLGILDQTTLEHIKTLSDAGDKDQAVTELLLALTQRTDEAHSAGVGLNSELGALASGAANLWSWLGKVNEQLQLFSAYGFASGGLQKQAADQAAAAAAAAQAEARANQLSAAGAAVYANTPEGRDQAQRQALQDSLGKARAALAIDSMSPDSAASAVRDATAIADYKHALDTWIPSAQKAHEISQLDAQISEAKHAKNKQLIDDLTQQRALLGQAGVVESAGDATQKAADAGALARDRSGGAAKHGPSIVSEWQEQLRAAEVASNDFFGDQTQRELDFWNGKVGQTTKGSKEWLEVQSRIYEAAKTLAHQSYDEHIAGLNDQIEADRNNWSKEQADWNAKLDFIKAHFGAESAEYKNAHREFEAAERQHQAQMLQIQRDGEREALDELKTNLAAQRTIREQDARTSEALIAQRANYSANPLAEVAAARRLLALHQQMNQAQLADDAATFIAADNLRTQAIADALHDYGQDSAQYAQAVNAKKQADTQYYAQRRTLENQMVQQTIQDNLKILQSWHSVVDPMVSSFGAGIKGMITGTETLRQAMANVGSTILDVIIGAIERWVEAQIVNAIVGKTLQEGTAATGVKAQAALAGAGGVASMAAAPFPLDLTAPEFGASMSAAALAFGAIGGFERGINVVPNDMLALVHAGERIVPGADNEALIGAVNRGAGAGGGDHYHLSPIINAIDGRSVRQFFRDHGQALMEELHARARNGPEPRWAVPARS